MLLADAIHPAHKAEDARLRHVILTRFNMRLFRDHRGIETESQLQQWVDRRTQIFTDICLPSVVAQQRPPHRWLIGVDGLHPEMVEPLAKECSPWPWIQIVQQLPGEGMREPFARALEPEARSRATHVVTTRLDCDDALAIDYTRVAQVYARAVLGTPDAPDDFWLSMPVGAQLVDGEYSLYVHTRNHFLTRVTPAHRAAELDANALHGKHSQIFAEKWRTYTPITSTPMWLQNVHGENALNAAIPGAALFASAQQMAATFGLAH